MAEGACGRLDAGDVARLGGVFMEHAAGLAEILKPLQRKEASFRQHLKQDRRPMTFAEQEAIAIWILGIGGIDVQLLPVERHQQLHAGEAGAQMGDLGGGRGGHEPLAQGQGGGSELGCSHGVASGAARSSCRIHFTV